MPNRNDDELKNSFFENAMLTPHVLFDNCFYTFLDVFESLLLS